jgi:hypothetical protein
VSRFPLPDEYQVGSLINGLPTCVYKPAMYHRVITNVVVTNTVTSSVACYRGVLGSVPVAQNLLGANNTLKGDIRIPAGQAFYVQWSAVGASVQQATARVSWVRDDNPLEVEAGNNAGQEWSTEAITSLQVPTGALLNEAAIVIGSDLPSCMQANYASAVMFRPRFNQAPDGAPIYFIAQRKNPLGANYVQTVDYGFVMNNGIMCGYVVQKRVSAGSFNGLGTDFTMLEQNAPNIEVSGLTVLTSQVQFDGAMDMFLLSTNTRFFAYGDQLSLRNAVENGACTATQNNAAAAFANYPTNVSFTINKVGSAGNTNLVATYAQTFVVDNALTGGRFGVNVSGGIGDFVTHQVPGNNPVGVRQSSVGMAPLTLIPPGTYTITPRWARTGGVGNLQSFVNDDWTSLKVTEEAV